MTTTFEQILQDRGRLVFTNTGNSMLPLLRQHRDLLVIDRVDDLTSDSTNSSAQKLKRLDVAFYKRDNGQYILHRILWARKNDYVLCGDNQYRPETGIQDRHILGVLVAVVRNGRTIPLRSTSLLPHVPFIYKLYVHLWCDLFVVRAPIVFLINRIQRLKRKR